MRVAKLKPPPLPTAAHPNEHGHLPHGQGGLERQPRLVARDALVLKVNAADLQAMRRRPPCNHVLRVQSGGAQPVQPQALLHGEATDLQQRTSNLALAREVEVQAAVGSEAGAWLGFTCHRVQATCTQPRLAPPGGAPPRSSEGMPCAPTPAHSQLHGGTDGQGATTGG